VIGDGLDDPDDGKDLRCIGGIIEDGAELVTGGKRLDRAGYFVEQVKMSWSGEGEGLFGSLDQGGPRRVDDP